MQLRFSDSSPPPRTPYSPLSITLPSALPSALPFFQLTSVRRTSGHCFGTFGAVNISVLYFSRNYCYDYYYYYYYYYVN